MTDSKIGRVLTTIILKSHPCSHYPGLFALLAYWRNALLDAERNGREVTIVINASPDLVADQTEIGDFLKSNYGRWHNLRITGSGTIHLNLPMNRHSYFTTKAVLEEYDHDKDNCETDRASGTSQNLPANGASPFILEAAFEDENENEDESIMSTCENENDDKSLFESDNEDFLNDLQFTQAY